MTLMGDAVARNDSECQLVRAAISRLRDNKAERSNGAHTVVALADESGIPRQRLYEHHSDLLNEFKATVGCGPVTPNTEALQRQLAQASDNNQELAAENAQLRCKIRTLSAVITELTHEASRANVVVSMPRKTPGAVTVLGVRCSATPPDGGCAPEGGPNKTCLVDESSGASMSQSE